MKKSVLIAWWVVICFFVVVFILMFLGALLDIKYTIEALPNVSKRVIETAYSHVYNLSTIIVIQFAIIIFFLGRNKTLGK